MGYRKKIKTHAQEKIFSSMLKNKEKTKKKR
jgi:hypothetical protein